MSPPDELPPWFPEVRDGPPWLTEEMILSEPGLASVVEELARPAADVANRVVEAARSGAPVVVAGSGTGEYAAAGVAELLDDALVRQGLSAPTVEQRESLEAALEPRSGGVFVGVSHGGRSRSTVSALEAAASRGAVTVLITADPSAPAAARAADLLVTPVRDASFCHTVAYLSPLLVGGAVAAAIDGRRLAAPTVRAHLEAALAVRSQAETAAARLSDSRWLITVGDGADAVSARELALKIEEAVRMPAAMRKIETVLHGHLVSADGTTGLVVFLADPRHRDRRAVHAERVLRTARRIGVRTVAVVTEDVAARLPRELATPGLVVVPEDPAIGGLLSALTASALALQLLTLGLVHEAGVNPDLIRREETAYREAAELAEAKIR